MQLRQLSHQFVAIQTCSFQAKAMFVCFIYLAFSSFMLFVCVLVILICKLDLALLNTRYTELVTVELYQEEMVAFDKVSCCW